MLKLNTIHCMDALEGLKKLPDESIDCVVTSPPYWALRDYEIAKTKWADGSECTLGLEKNCTSYIEHLCELFDEIKRVLKKTGTVWVNLGDTYSGNWGNYHRKISNALKSKWKNIADYDARLKSFYNKPVVKKSLCLIPERFVLEMTNRGWILRNKIIWHKTNHMPSSVKDRLTNSWEYMFMFVKNSKCYFDLDAVRVPHKSLDRVKSLKVSKRRESPCICKGRLPPEVGDAQALHPKGKNPSDYWNISPEVRSKKALVGFKDLGIKKKTGWDIVKEQDPRWLSPLGKNPGDCIETATASYKGAHFAVYPEKLCELPIKAGCAEKVCRKCGMPYLEVSSGMGSASKGNRSHFRKKRGLRCSCNAGFEPGVVLDPFMGSGTTAVVARKLGRRFLGFEMNSDYVRMARGRMRR